MTGSDELRALLGEVIFQINTELTMMVTAKQQSIDMARSIAAFGAHNMDVQAAISTLRMTVPDEIDRVIVQYKMAIAAMEDYRNGI